MDNIVRLAVGLLRAAGAARGEFQGREFQGRNSEFDAGPLMTRAADGSCYRRHGA